MSDKEPYALFNPFAMWEPVINFWFGAMTAATQETLKFWQNPFNPPLEDEREVEGDLDIPGPLEREFEHNLHA
ncbi:MAG: hypothetical protein ABS49_00705 [Erythrobacter sp. SCN 62-14]|nr:MAG: hypothetical protein ABS49_00705 [Erythrobacter sp. SCN 62-14]